MSSNRAENQLPLYKENQKNKTTAVTSNGAPLSSQTATLTAGECGPVLLRDVNFLDEIAHFNRERIPERVVHAKGAGAFGYFEVTHDISKYCAAKVFEGIGKRTPVGVRFSTVVGENGSPDTVRNNRGFAVKFYTEDGVWDLVGNNSPIFFIRDPILFPSFMHTLKPNPVTHLKDANMVWDFVTLRPETTHQVMMLFADRGIPDGYRFMHGYGSHTFKLVNANGEPVYCKFHLRSNQGIKNIDDQRAVELAGADRDYAIRDLYNAIANGEFPSWTLNIQVMTYEQAEKNSFNPFDLTKVWPQGEFPLIPVGCLVLDRNPKNYFAEVEQIAFAPSNLVPGIEPSPDKMLQGRLFAYADAQRHRLGVNNMQIPVNCPYRVISTTNYHRDGPMNCTDNQGGAPNYYPNSFGGPEPSPSARKLQNPKECITGDVDRFETRDEDNFSQASVFYRCILDEPARERMIIAFAKRISGAAPFIQERAVKNFTQVDVDFGRRMAEALKLRNSAKL